MFFLAVADISAYPECVDQQIHLHFLCPILTHLALPDLTVHFLHEFFDTWVCVAVELLEEHLGLLSLHALQEFLVLYGVTQRKSLLCDQLSVFFLEGFGEPVLRHL